MATQAQMKAFIETIAPIAVRQAARHGNKIFPSVCIAQACCESAYGTSEKMVRANAVFGIKVGGGRYHFGTAWKDKAYSTKTKECYDGKTYTQITDFFRAYDSLEEAVEDYFDLLCTAKRYQYALNQPTPLACITGIQKGPYATSPTYISTIMAIINRNGLTQYDPGAVKGNFTVGLTYKTLYNMYVRNAPAGEHLCYEDLTADGKTHAIQDENGVILLQNTKVTVREIERLDDGAVWLRIPSGWICGWGAGGNIYVA